MGLCCFSPSLLISFSLVILGFIRSLVLREFPVGGGGVWTMFDFSWKGFYTGSSNNTGQYF
ncbi:hypothetical protein SiRe_0855 [Sulfolobus islandicus REY15A]|uniref:Uncharacterized protein n=1 Tax=Saccharolobus islandicus (strain REY15A) TaxID=930945 RepID=F0NDZ4_SACI5|nr:hypothetical protein SiRe_0855 [Sulfolobus islandicus REY15A]